MVGQSRPRVPDVRQTPVPQGIREPVHNDRGAPAKIFSIHCRPSSAPASVAHRNAPSGAPNDDG